MPRMGTWWKKSTYTLEKVWVPILQVSQFDAFHCIFLCYEKLMGNSFVSQVMKYTIGWESDRKKPQILLGMYGNRQLSQVSPGFPRFSPYMFFLHILVLWEINGELTHFTYDEVYHKMRIGWEKSTHTMGKLWVPVSQVLSIWWVLFHFLVLWEIFGKTHAFPVLLDLLIFSSVG